MPARRQWLEPDRASSRSIAAIASSASDPPSAAAGKLSIGSGIYHVRTIIARLRVALGHCQPLPSAAVRSGELRTRTICTVVHPNAANGATGIDATQQQQRYGARACMTSRSR